MGVERALASMACRHGTAVAAGILSGLVGRRLRRRFSARRASRCARTAVPTGIAPLQFPQMNDPSTLTRKDVEPLTVRC